MSGDRTISTGRRQVVLDCAIGLFFLMRIAPALISTLGECLTPPLRRQIETTFACQLRDCYGCSEVQVIAFECTHGTLYVNADWVIV